ncbi:MAG: hypothetical protein ABW208_00880 [Pyrinomonadaceae bacterium]
MLRVRQEQMDGLAAAAEAEADGRLVEYGRSRFREEFDAMTGGEALGLISEVRRKAKARGVTAEADIATALDLTVMYGPDFYLDEWASDVFAVEEWGGGHKMEVLRERVRRRLPDF